MNHTPQKGIPIFKTRFNYLIESSLNGYIRADLDQAGFYMEYQMREEDNRYNRYRWATTKETSIWFYSQEECETSVLAAFNVRTRRGLLYLVEESEVSLEEVLGL